MNRFGTLLRANLLALPANVRQGLRPDATQEGESLRARMRRSFVFHLHPVEVTVRALAPTTTLGLGLINLTLLLVLISSGVLLMLYYVPTPGAAHGSVQDIEYAVSLGSFVRAAHRWAAHAVVLVAFFHLLRVFFTGAYFGRELNWTIGLGMFLCILGLAFTGYLLPWDQRSFWAVSVSSNLLDQIPWIGGGLKQLLLGGRHVGQAALVRFYGAHVALLPGLLLGLAVLHGWRIRRDGGLAREPGELPVLPAWPHLLLREAVVVLSVLAFLCFFALLVAAPLGGAPDLHSPSNPEKTPWYFLWLQEAVSYSAPVGGVVFPGLLACGLLLVPFLDREPGGVGRWFGVPGRGVRVGITVAISVGLFVLFEWIYMRAGFASWLALRGPVAADLLNPATAMLLLAVAAFLGAGTAARSTRAAFVAAGLVLVVAVVGLTVVAWCRGPMWVFSWPWEGSSLAL